MHTKPQFFWLENCDLKNITVIKYTKENLLEKFKDVVYEHITKTKTLLYDQSDIFKKKSKNVYTKEKINITKFDRDEKDNFSLNQDQERFVRSYFHKDFELWEKITNHPELFKKVI